MLLASKPKCTHTTTPPPHTHTPLEAEHVVARLLQARRALRLGHQADALNHCVLWIHVGKVCACMRALDAEVRWGALLCQCTWKLLAR